MKKIFFGLLSGLAVCAIAAYVAVPKITKKYYSNGFSDGSRDGLLKGTSIGIAQGIAQVEAREKHERDSVTVAQRVLETQRLAAQKRRSKAVVKVVQNWHVIDGKIADPITD